MNPPQAQLPSDDPLAEVDSLQPVFEALAQPRPGDAELLAGYVDGALAAEAVCAPGSDAVARSRRWLRIVGGAGALGLAVVALGPLSGGGGEGPEGPEVAASARVEPEAFESEELRAPDEAEEPDAPELEPVEVSAPVEVALTPEASAPAKAEEPEEPSAAQLLERANAARRRGDSERALKLYASLLSRHAGSREAQTALVARGRLRLDRLGAPESAVADFERYLRDHPRGPLAREAAVGRARAWRAAGRDAAERDAWAYVLERYPESIHAATAQQRLAVLEP